VIRVRATGNAEQLKCPHCGHTVDPAVFAGKEYVAYPKRTMDLVWICASCKGKIPRKGVWVETAGNPKDAGYWPLDAIELDEAVIEENAR